jgi:hypothetical protein
LKEPGDVRFINRVMASLILLMYCVLSAVASAVGEMWAGRAG